MRGVRSLLVIFLLFWIILKSSGWFIQYPDYRVEKTHALELGRATIDHLEWHPRQDIFLVSNNIYGDTWLYDANLNDVGHIYGLREAAFNHDGKLIAGIQPDDTLVIYDMVTLEERYNRQFKTDFKFSWHPLRDEIAVYHGKHLTMWLPRRDQDRLHISISRGYQGNSPDYSPGGRTITLVGGIRMTFWEAETGRKLHPPGLWCGNVFDSRTTTRFHWIDDYSGVCDHLEYRTSSNIQKFLYPYEGPNHEFSEYLRCPDSPSYVTSTVSRSSMTYAYGLYCRFDLRTYEQIPDNPEAPDNLPLFEQEFQRVLYSPDDRWLTGINYDDSVYVVDNVNHTTRQLEQLATTETIAFSTNSHYLAMSDHDHQLSVYDTRDWSLRGFSDVHGMSSRTTTLSPDGKTLATSDFNGTVRLFDVATGEQVHMLSGYRGFINQHAWSDDSELIALWALKPHHRYFINDIGIPYEDPEVRIYERKSGQMIEHFVMQNIMVVDWIGDELVMVDGDVSRAYIWKRNMRSIYVVNVNNWIEGQIIPSPDETSFLTVDWKYSSKCFQQFSFPDLQRINQIVCVEHDLPYTLDIGYMDNGNIRTVAAVQYEDWIDMKASVFAGWFDYFRVAPQPWRQRSIDHAARKVSWLPGAKEFLLEDKNNGHTTLWNAHAMKPLITFDFSYDLISPDGRFITTRDFRDFDPESKDGIFYLEGLSFVEREFFDRWTRFHWYPDNSGFYTVYGPHITFYDLVAD